MATIELIDITKKFDTKLIFKPFSLSIAQKDRIFIVGKNGAGKSTLIKIILGQMEPDEGRVILEGNLAIENLPQNPVFAYDLSVRETIKKELTDIEAAKSRFEELSELIANDHTNQALLNEQSTIISYLDHHSAWDIENKVERIIAEFDLKELEHTNIHLLSGGEQRRVALAILLLKKPDILLLDEPTNHLDVYMVEFIEELLLKENFTVIIISHDRYFIENVATKVIEIDDGEVRSFEGGYLNYLAKKEEILKNLTKEHENLLGLLKREEYWLQHGISARRKRNERRKAELMKLRVDAKKNPSLIRKMKIELTREATKVDKDEKINRKKMLFELHDVTLKAGEKTLFEHFTTRVLMQDKIAIVGPNGSGKTTLLNLILGDNTPTKGHIKKGEFVTGFLSQTRSVLDDTKNLIETFCPNGGDSVDVKGHNVHVYAYMKNFLFPKEYLNMKLGSLSGGEKNRVALALLLSKKVDCLILDEPTNDLDIATINILEEHLLNFEGAVIFVSHDRYFVDKIAKKLFIFEHKKIIESTGSYTEYLDVQKELKELDELESDTAPTTKIEIERIKEKPKKLSFKEQKDLVELPALIEALESEIKSIKLCLTNEDCYRQKGIVELSRQLESLEAELEVKLIRYLEVEELAASLG